MIKLNEKEEVDRKVSKCDYIRYSPSEINTFIYVGLVSGDGPFESDVGIVNLHPCHVSHWALYFHE